MRALAIIALFAATPSVAQQVWTPAPVPSVQPADAVNPADRTGASSTSDNSAPFSGKPTASFETGGTASTSTTPTAGAPDASQ